MKMNETKKLHQHNNIYDYIDIHNIVYLNNMRGGGGQEMGVTLIEASLLMAHQQ